MIAWLRKAWRWVVMAAVAIVCALVPGALWLRERKRRRALERSIDIQTEHLAIAAETMRAKDHALTEMTRKLGDLRRQAEAAEAEFDGREKELRELAPDEAWERAFGRGAD